MVGRNRDTEHIWDYNVVNIISLPPRRLRIILLRHGIVFVWWFIFYPVQFGPLPPGPVFSVNRHRAQ